MADKRPLSALGARLLALPVHAYRAVVSPLLPAACRFTPTCSAYALEALQRHGAIKGTTLTAKRLARCRPGGGKGYDPVPVPLPEWFRDVDVHTHQDPGDGSAIVSIDVNTQEIPDGPGPFSIGIHSWWLTEENAEEAFHKLLESSKKEKVVAIGECGIDLLRGPDAELQQRVFERQASLADSLGLPLIIHCVRAYHLILESHKRLNPRSPWIIHGFRGKEALAAQLTSRGLYLSLGPKSPQYLSINPAFLLRETDSQPNI